MVTMVVSALLLKTFILLIATTTIIEMIEGVRMHMKISKDVAKYVCRQRTRFVKLGVPEKPISKRYRPISPLRCGWYLFGNCGKGSCSYKKYKNCSGSVTDDTFVQTRIQGGKEALPHGYPSMVLLKKANRICGAVIISEEWVLTAAHCTADDYEQDIILLAGRHNLRVNESQSEQRIEGVKKIYEYPTYRGNGTTIAHNDISLLELYNDEKFVLQHPYVDYAELAPSSYNATGKAKLVGWGERTVISHVITLREAEMTILSDLECKKSIRDSVGYDHICTYDKHKSGCDGDSGGPLYQVVDGDVVVIGILTWMGPNCTGDNLPTIFAEVSHYWNWISYHTKC